MNFENRNIDLKERIKHCGLKYWQLGEILGVSDVTISRWLRSELDENKKERIKEAIKEFETSREV